MRKRQIWVSERHFGEVRGEARPGLMARCKHVVDFLFVLFALIDFFRYLRVPELWGEMCTARLFSKRVDFFALKFYLDRVVPYQPFLASDN